MNQKKENAKCKNISHNSNSETLSLITQNQKEITNLGKKRHWSDNMKIDKENELLEENFFKEIKYNKKAKVKGDKINKLSNNNNFLILNEEEKSTNISAYEKLYKNLLLNNIVKENLKSSFKPKNQNQKSENNAMYNNLSIVIKFMQIQDLSNEILSLMKEFKINKENLDLFYKLKIDDLTSKLSINCGVFNV